MKTEELKARGLTDEQIEFVIAENGKEIKREKDRADDYKQQLETAKKSLEAFDGVDVAQLRGQITKLSGDLAAQEANHKKELAERDAERDFNDLVGKYAAEYKARDVKAVMPFLDADKLRQSKNQNDDIKAAFEAVKKDNAYLFEDENIPRVVSYTSGPDSTLNDAKTKANEALRQFFGKE